MTCIAGIIDKTVGKVYLGADTQAVDGWTSYQMPGSKIFRLGEFVVGVSGSARDSQKVQHLDLPSFVIRGRWGRQTGALTLDQYLAGPFADALLGLNLKDESSLLLAYRDRLFAIDGQRAAIEQAEYGAIGSGESIALGAFAATEDKDPKTRLDLALQSAARHNIGVARPFTYLETT